MSLDRRNFLQVCSQFGFASTLLPGVLYAQATRTGGKRITADMVTRSAAIAGIAVTPDEVAAMVPILNSNRRSFDQLRALEMPNSGRGARDRNALASRSSGRCHASLGKTAQIQPCLYRYRSYRALRRPDRLSHPRAAVCARLVRGYESECQQHAEIPRRRVRGSRS